MPGQQQRVKSVRRKLNPMMMEFNGKNVLIVDDSIVRGTTSKEIVQMARDSGAKKVYFASCAPPIRYPNVYGIDMPSRQELVAFDKSEEEIATAIGADCVIYQVIYVWLSNQNLDDLITSVAKFNRSIKTFDVSVFNGCYVTGDVSPEYLNDLETSRSDGKKSLNDSLAAEVIGLHNNLKIY